MHAMTEVLVMILLVLFSCEEVQSLTLTSLPDVLFSGGSKTILEGSVVRLNCLGIPISPNLTLTWNKDGEPLVQDVPHIRLRSSSSSSNKGITSILILVVDDFQISDSGVYQCIAQDGNIITTGKISSLSANASQAVDGTIRIITGDFITTLSSPYTNRIGYTIGTLVSHQYVVGHVGDSSTAYQTPSVLWLKDGIPLRIAPMNTPGTNGRLTTSILFTFAASDAGVYQVVFNDTIRSESFITDPIRLDTGETLSIKAVSPPITILRPSEKLVLEVTATGRYDKIQWLRNGTLIRGSIYNFHEVLLNDMDTTAEILGVYEVIISPPQASGQMIFEGIYFIVLQFVPINTDVSSGADAPVYEGGNVDISCTSTGVPVPSIITWTFNNQATSYLQSDIYTDYSVNYNTNNFSVGIFPGNVVSTLHIVNAQYPADAGEYVCTGSNNAGVTSTATITLWFLGLWPLVVASFPEVLFNGESQSLVEGSVAWLYCEANSTASTLTVTWYKDGNALVQDLPHIITRKTGASIFLLIVNDLQVSDSGEYQCSALDEYSGDTGMGKVLTLTVSAATTDALQAEDSPTQTFIANRGAYTSGDTATISCRAGYQSSVPGVIWLKDGVPVIHTPTNTQDSSNRLTTTISFTFTEFDAGVYQCIFNDTTRSELLADTPIQIDTGPPSIERLSPSTIIIHPPQKLVMEVRVAGDYSLIQWNKNGNYLPTSSNNIILDSFPHFTEIYFIEPTTMADAGVYDVFAHTTSGLATPDPVQFAVIEPVDATTSVSTSVVEISEKGFVNISCTSTGVPVPTITWTFNNQPTVFTQTDTSTNHSVTVNGLSIAVTEGNVVSTLHIVNAQYPANAGEYVCIGSNTYGDSTTSSSATITVDIPVPPEVDVTVPHFGVHQGDDVTLTCNIIRANPMVYTYTWIHVDTSTLFTAETTLSLPSIRFDQLGTYRCDVRNSVGVGRDAITIELGYGAQISAPQLVVGIEGNDTRISCNSTGIPVPTITWTINSQPVPYMQTNLTTDYRITFLEENSYQIDQGVVFSSLLIANLQYSANDNVVLTCMGFNIHGEDSALIRLKVLVPPEIEVTTDHTTASMLDTVTLTCIATRAVPMPDNYTWIHVDTNTTLVVGSSSTYTFTPFKDEIHGTYRCEVITTAGFGMDTITIELEDVPTLDVVSIPDVLFSGGSQNILEGSVVWLYCLTVPKSPTVTVTWSRDGEPLVQDVPHIRLRSTGSDADMYSTFLLVVEPVEVTDGGVYQCSAQEGENIAMGPALTITVDTSGMKGAIVIKRRGDIIESHQSGDVINLYYFVDRVGNDSISYQIPSVLWLKDGIPSRTTPTNTPMANGRLTTELIFTFTESDGGIYQLVSTSTNDDGRLTMSLAHPIRLNTGETLSIEALSPSDTILRPTEKLVLEVRAGGPYRSIEWRKNGNSTFLSDDDNFAHFVEIYFNESIGISDFGVYDVILSLVPPVGVQFTVTQYDDADTSSGAPEVFIFEGENVNISCISFGVPVPTITWTFSNQPTSFTQTDTSTDHNVTVTSDQATVVTQGNVVSTLHIVDAQYITNTGEYVCTGSNTNGDFTTFSSARITVDIPDSHILDVNVTADRTGVLLGDDVTMTCSATGGDPIIYTYTWTHVDTSTTLTAGTSPTLSLSLSSMDELGNYRCVIRSDTYVGMDTITFRLGDAPEVTVRVAPPGPVIKGSIVNLVCEATAGDPPISYSWTGPTGKDLSSDSNSGTISVTFSARRDYGNYICTADSRFGTDISQVDVVQADAAILFDMGPCLSVMIPNCTEWINVNPDEKTNDLELEILSAINQQCQCNVERDQITISPFICLSILPDSVSFFLTINGVPTSELLGYLESWVVASGAKVTVQSQQMDVDIGNCRVSKFLEREAAIIVSVSLLVAAFLFCILAVAIGLYIKNYTKQKVLPLSPLERVQPPRSSRLLPPLKVHAPMPSTLPSLKIASPPESLPSANKMLSSLKMVPLVSHNVAPLGISPPKIHPEESPLFEDSPLQLSEESFLRENTCLSGCLSLENLSHDPVSISKSRSYYNTL